MLIVDGDRLVFIRRGPNIARPHYWTPPTGRIESGESARDALRREACEELQLEIEPVRAVFACDTDDGRFRLHWWICHPRSQTLVPDGHEVVDARWMRVPEWLRLEPTFASHRLFFTQLWPAVSRSR